jgi:peroxiredoxin
MERRTRNGHPARVAHVHTQFMQVPRRIHCWLRFWSQMALWAAKEQHMAGMTTSDSRRSDIKAARPWPLVERFDDPALLSPGIASIVVPAGILEAARELAAGPIVMASHARGGLVRWLTGSVADEVLRHSTVPVLVIRAEDIAWSLDGGQLRAAAGGALARHTPREHGARGARLGGVSHASDARRHFPAAHRPSANIQVDLCACITRGRTTVNQPRGTNDTKLQPFLSGPGTGRLVRHFALPSTDGSMVGLSDHKQRHNMVILLHHGPSCRTCRSTLIEFNQSVDTFRQAEAVVLAISSDALAVLRSFASDFGLQFPLLSDPTGQVARNENLTIPAIVVTDRFGEVWAAWSSDDTHTLPSMEEVRGWLEFIELQCRECEAPEWPLTSDD